MTDARFTTLHPLADARGHVVGGSPVGDAPGAILPRLRTAAIELGDELRASGRPSGIATRDLVTQPHPTTYGLFRAASSPVPYLWLTDRMVVVTWEEGARTRTLVWGPSDHERDAATPAVARMRSRFPGPAALLTRRHGTVPRHLRSLGIDPADVDYVAFDHLHTQDLRRVLGTATESGWLPNAELLVQRSEWDSVRQPHPLQSPWYQPETFDELDEERIAVVDGDLLLGPGVALVCTPGHTMGNQSLALHTSAGVQVVSGNGVAAESWAPEASRLPGLARHTRETGLEVIPRASTLEFASWQYGSMVAEVALADRTPDGRFPLILPSGELTAHRLAPGLSPTHRMLGLADGRVRPSRVTVRGGSTSGPRAGSRHTGAKGVVTSLRPQRA